MAENILLSGMTLRTVRDWRYCSRMFARGLFADLVYVYVSTTRYIM